MELKISIILEWDIKKLWLYLTPILLCISCIQILRTDTGFQDFIFHQDFFLLNFFLQFKYLLSSSLYNELSKISNELEVDKEQSNTQEFKI